MAPLQDQVLPVDLGSGVDTKTDPKLVVPGKLLRLENAVFTKSKRLSKRNGYSKLSDVIASVGTLNSPRLCHSLNDELLTSDDGKLLSWSPSENTWVSRGEYTSVDLERSVIDQSTPSSGATDVAILGQYALYGWSTSIQLITVPTYFLPQVLSKTYGSVVDMQTGAVISVGGTETSTGSQLLSTKTVINYTVVKCVRLSTTALAIIYTNEDLTAIVSRVVQFGGSGVVTFSNETTISTAFNGFSFDVATTATGAAIIYPTAAGVTVSLLNTSGAVTSSASIADAGATSPVHLSVDAAGLIWVYWCNDTRQDLKYAVYSSALAPVLGITTIVNSASIFDRISNIISVSTSATAQNVYYGTLETLIDKTTVVSVTTSGVIGSLNLFARGVAPFSKPITIGSNSYAVFAYRGFDSGVDQQTTVKNSFPTAFMLRLDNDTNTGIPSVVSRFATGLANSQIFIGSPDGIYKTGTGDISYTPSLVSLSATSFMMGMGVLTQEYPTDSYIGGTIPNPGGLCGSWAYTFDIDSEESYSAVNVGEMAILNGSCVHAYDGLQVNELNFHTIPEIQAQVGAGASAIGAGTYSYIAIYQWTDANGNLHQSTPSVPYTITILANEVVDITVTTAYLSQKEGVSVAIYRTKEASSGAGGNYYLVTNPVFLLNASAAISEFVTFSDYLPDASINGNPLAYTYPGSSVLENSAPPPSMILLAHNNRLWMTDAEEPSTVWYTKSFQQFVGVSPSAFLADQIDPKFGNITALGEMDEKIIIFKEDGIFYRSGDGANDNGQSSTLSFPQFVPSDVGCISHKSIVTTPNGIMFKSGKGIYVMSRGLQVMYLGLEVEQYNSQFITSAKLIDGKSQIRFLCSTGLTLVYDYIFNQWSTFTNHTGYGATNWQGAYTYVTTGGDVYVENSGYLDDVTQYTMLLQTSWLALASVQGFQRVKRVLVLGDYINGADATHGFSVNAAYDFNPTLTLTVPYSFGAALSSGIVQYRERLQRQKCDSVSLTIQEINASASESYVDIVNLSFVAGVKRGANKLAQPATVG